MATIQTFTALEYLTEIKQLEDTVRNIEKIIEKYYLLKPLVITDNSTTIKTWYEVQNLAGI